MTSGRLLSLFRRMAILADGHDTVVAPIKYDDISLRDEEPYFVARLGDSTVLLDTAPRGMGRAGE